MDELLRKIRSRRATRAGKATRNLADDLDGWVDDNRIVADKAHVELAWSVSTDSPHALHKGTPDESRLIEVTRTRRASGSLQIYKRHPNLQRAEARAQSLAFRSACSLNLNPNYVIEADPMAPSPQPWTRRTPGR